MADKNLRLQITLAALDKVTSPLKSISGAASVANRDLAKTHAQLRTFDALQKQINGFKAKESRYAADTQKLAAATAELDKLRATLDATENPTKKLRAEFDKAERRTKQLAASIDAGGDELQQLSAKLSAAGVDVGDLARHESRLADQVYEANQALAKQKDQLEKIDNAKRNSEKLSEIGGKATGIGAGMIGAGVAIGAPIVVATKQAMNLESAMAGVRKRITFDSPDEFQKMTDDVVELSTRIPIAAEELAKIMSAGADAKVGKGELLKFTEDAATMAVALDTSADVAGATMAKWRTAFAMGQEEVATLGDKINALTSGRGGNVNDVSEMVTRIGSLGEVSGAYADEIAAIGHVMSSVGINGEIGATGIKNLLLSLNKGTSATKAQQGAFAALGLDAEQMAKDMQRDAGGAITNILSRIAELPEHARSGILTQLFGSESVTAIAPMLTNLKLLKENFGLVGDQTKYAGSMNAEFLASLATTEGATGLMANAATAVNLELGKFLLPTVVEVAKKVRDFALATREWIQENPNISKALMIFVGGGAALLIVIGGLIMGFGALALSAALLGLSLWPLLAIIAAVAALVAIGYVLYSNWGSIVEWWKGAWQTIKDAGSAALDGLISAFLKFTPLGWIITAMMPVINYLRNLDFAAIGRHLIDGLITGIKEKWAALKATVTGLGGMITNAFSKKMDIHSPSRVFATLGGHVMAGLDQGLSVNASDPISRIMGLSDQMTRALAIGVGGAAAVAAAPAAAATGSASGSAAPAASAVYKITIHAGAAHAQDIADQVRAAIEQIEREKSGRSFGDD